MSSRWIGGALSCFGLTKFPESTRRHDRRAFESSEHQQVLVTRHDSPGVSGLDQSEHHEVIWIPTRLRIKFLGPHDFDILPEELQVFGNDAGRNLDLGPEFVRNLPTNLKCLCGRVVR